MSFETERPFNGPTLERPRKCKRVEDTNVESIPQGFDAVKLPKREGLSAMTSSQARFALKHNAPPELIENLLNDGGLSCFYGVKGTNKTFALMDIAYRVAIGEPWCGLATQQGLVVYVLAEGGGTGAQAREVALNDIHRPDNDSLFQLVAGQIDLYSNSHDLNDLIALIRKLEAQTGQRCIWVIVDTLNAVLADADENSSVGMGKMISVAKLIQRQFGAHFTYVHHPKEGNHRPRGHSSLLGAVDTAVEVCDGQLKVVRYRHGEDGAVYGFTRHNIVVGDYDNGKPIGTCYVEWTGSAKPHLAVVADNTKAAKPARNGQATIVLNAIKAAIATEGFELPSKYGAPEGTRCVRVETWKSRAFAAGLTASKDKDSAKATWYRAKKSVEGNVAVDGGLAWLR